MACMYENLESIKKLEPTIDYAMRTIPESKDEYVKFIFSMTKPAKEES